MGKRQSTPILTIGKRLLWLAPSKSATEYLLRIIWRGNYLPLRS
jgi:hypothetical protein